MRFLATILALLAAFPAFADARLKLVSDRPVVIVVNLKPHPVGDQAPVMVDIADGREGTQRITVRNLAGQQMYSGTVVVPAATVVTVAWRDKQLEVVDKARMKTSQAFNRSGGSRQKSPAGHKRLDDLAAGGTEPRDDLLSLASSSTAFVPQVIPDDGGEPEEAPGDGATDDVAPVTDEDGRPVAQIAVGENASRPGKGSSQKILETDRSAGAAQTAVIRMAARSESWANVWVGEEKVWEHRGEADAMEVTLAAGAHEIIIRDFRDRDIWGRGTLIISPGERAEVHFSKAQPIETVGGQWTPAK